MAFERTQSRSVIGSGTPAQLHNGESSTSRACRRRRRRTAARVLHLLEHRRNSDSRRGTRTPSCHRAPSAGYVSRAAAVALEAPLDTPGALSSARRVVRSKRKGCADHLAQCRRLSLAARSKGIDQAQKLYPRACHSHRGRGRACRRKAVATRPPRGQG